MTWPRPIPEVGDKSSAAERSRDPSAWRFGEAERAALYQVIAARRDVRRFRSLPVGEELLGRLLAAAHAGPSVGHSQPWRFVVVTDATARERAALIAERERLRQANLLGDDARRRMLDLQLDGIKEAPLGVVVCCDRRAPAAGVLGRATFPDSDIWSCACAIENLWLAARAEGLGVGWVTLFPPEELARLVGLPPGVETLGWLCVGWPDERPPEPGLERAGWSRRAPLASVVLRERWPQAGPPAPPSALRAPAPDAVVAARDEADLLLTPPGSLGALDRALDRLAALGIGRGGRAHAVWPTNEPRALGASLVLVAADHPVTAHRVSAYAAPVTREVLEATVAGESLGAAAARAAGLEVVAIDAGVEGPPVPGAVTLRCRGARGDLVNNDAMAPDDASALLEAGRQLAKALECELVALGEAGVGNTTVAAALSAAWLGLSARDTVGLGASGDSPTVERKVTVVQAALERARADGPLGVLAALGGPEFAVLTGVVLGTAERGRAVVLDGLATSVAALGAVLLEPGAAAHLIAGQRSREKAHAHVLVQLGLEPLLDLRLRAGEGVGAVLACDLLATGLKMRALTGRVTA